MFKISVSCGGTIEAEKGELMSPGYPGNYKANKKCQWDIIVPKVRKIHSLLATHTGLIYVVV